MSEYQYYEFVAVDRPLTKEEMAKLREITTRATITPTRLQNEYQWGSFKGNPQTLMERYFDAFLYYANWGTNRLMLRLPRSLLDLETASLYCYCDPASARETSSHVILDFVSDDEDGGQEWDLEGEDLSSLIPLRGEIAAGDLRCLYLGWLLCAERDLVGDEIEPPVPPGLSELTGPEQAFASFMRIDEDLIAVAAQRSPRQTGSPSPEDFERWVRGLPEVEKDEWLLRLARSDSPNLRAEMLRQFRQTRPREHPKDQGDGRTVAELLQAAEEHREARERREAEQAAAERARQEREQAAARERYLATLAGREAEIWLRAESLAGERRGPAYAEAVRLLQDLRDVAARQGQSDLFAIQLRQFRELHAAKTALMGRMEKAGL